MELQHRPSCVGSGISLKKLMKSLLLGEAVIIELDEMWHYLHSKKTNYGSGKLIVARPVNSLTGNVAIVTKALLQD